MNKIVCIGYIGLKKCYLNLSKEESIERYIKSEGITEEVFNNSYINVYEIEFDDEFCAYEIWGE